MIRGVQIHPFMVSGIITVTIFMARAFYKFTTNWLLDILNDPLVVFVLLLVAATIVLFPLLRGWKTLILTPIIVIGVAFFVYAYYIVP